MWLLIFFFFSQVGILIWWKNKFPLPTQLARNYHGVPMSSSASKRVFSTAGNIVIDTRNNLDPRTMDMLLFCQQNYERITVKEWNYICAEEIAAEEEQKPQQAASDEAEAEPFNLSRAGDQVSQNQQIY